MKIRWFKSRCGPIDSQPSQCHLAAKATGGIKLLFLQIKTRSVPGQPDGGSYTDLEGCFDAGDVLCLLARRYRYLGVLGSGQSAVVIKAQDTFCGDKPVAIKILHSHYYHLGAQETDLFLKLQGSDPFGFSPIVKLLNMFTFDDHYCMVFELLYSPNWTRLFHPSHQPSNNEAVYKKIRKVALGLFQALGFLQIQNVIHTDLKPDNLFFKTEDDPSSLRVADLGNAIQCVYNEVSLYYDAFELQALLYRAPEVIFGLQFGCEIDMWSVGCILAEFYLGKPLFYGNSREDVLKKMVEILGPVPRSFVQRGKFYSDLEMFTSAGTQPDATSSLRTVLDTGPVEKPISYAFVNFLAQLLRYDPAERLSHTDAACHPFMAMEIGLGYILPPAPNHSGQTRHYPSILLTKDSYTHKPVVHKEISSQHPSSLDLLYMGTSAYSSREGTLTENFTRRQVAKVLPFGFQDTTKRLYPNQSAAIPESMSVVSEQDVQNAGSTTRESQHSANRRTPHTGQSTEIIRSKPVVFSGRDVQNAGSTTRESQHSANRRTPHTGKSTRNLGSTPVVSERDVQNAGSTTRESQHSANRRTPHTGQSTRNLGSTPVVSERDVQNAGSTTRESQHSANRQTVHTGKSAAIPEATPVVSERDVQNAGSTTRESQHSANRPTPHTGKSTRNLGSTPVLSEQDVQNAGSTTRESQHSANRRRPHTGKSAAIPEAMSVVIGRDVQNAGSTTRESQHSANRRTPHTGQSSEIIQSMDVVSEGDAENAGSTMRDLTHTFNRQTKSENLHYVFSVEAENAKKAKRLKSTKVSVCSAEPSRTVQGYQHSNIEPQQNWALYSPEIKNKIRNCYKMLPQPNLSSESSKISITELENRNQAIQRKGTVDKTILRKRKVDKTISRKGKVNKTLPIQKTSLKSPPKHENRTIQGYQNATMTLSQQSLLFKSPKVSNSLPESKRKTVHPKKKANRRLSQQNMVVSSNSFECEWTSDQNSLKASTQHDVQPKPFHLKCGVKHQAINQSTKLFHNIETASSENHKSERKSKNRCLNFTDRYDSHFKLEKTSSRCKDASGADHVRENSHHNNYDTTVSYDEEAYNNDTTVSYDEEAYNNDITVSSDEEAYNNDTTVSYDKEAYNNDITVSSDEEAYNNDTTVAYDKEAHNNDTTVSCDEEAYNNDITVSCDEEEEIVLLTL